MAPAGQAEEVVEAVPAAAQAAPPPPAAEPAAAAEQAAQAAARIMQAAPPPKRRKNARGRGAGGGGPAAQQEMVRLGPEVARASERLRTGWHPVQLSAEDKAVDIELDAAQLAACSRGGYRMVGAEPAAPAPRRHAAVAFACCQERSWEGLAVGKPACCGTSL